MWIGLVISDSSGAVVEPWFLTRCKALDMFIIRNKLAEDLRPSTAKDALNRLVQRVELACPQSQAGLTAEQHRAAVASAIEQARSYGIREERYIARFLDYRFSLGDHWDGDVTWAWVRETFEDTSLTEVEKIEAIDSVLYYGPVLSP
jgi:hypothetical protein